MSEPKKTVWVAVTEVVDDHSISYDVEGVFTDKEVAQMASDTEPLEMVIDEFADRLKNGERVWSVIINPDGSIDHCEQEIGTIKDDVELVSRAYFIWARSGEEAVERVRRLKVVK